MNPKDLLTIQNELLEVIAARGGLKGLMTTLLDYIKKPIIITNSSFTVLTSSTDSGVNEKEFVNFTLEESEAGKGVIKGTCGATPFLLFRIKDSKRTLGYLFILNPEAESLILLQLGKQASRVAALELGRQNDLVALEQSYKDAFVFDLLYGNLESQDEIILRGEIMGWNLHKPHGVIVFEIQNYEHFSEDKQWVMLLYDIMEIVLSELHEKAIMMRKKGEVILILPMSRETKKEQRTYMRLLVGKVKALVEQKLPEKVVRVGVGRNYDSPVEIFRSYQEAKVALELGNLVNTHGNTPFFVELGLTRILYNHDGQELKEFYRETLGELERYDNSQGGELMDTLEKFLVHRCDLKGTANALFLHPNTLRYRLKKIEEILGVSLDDLDSKLDIMAALKIKYLGKF